MKRRLINLFLLCALILVSGNVLTGCGNTTGTNSQSKSGKMEKDVTLTVWGDQANQSVTEPAFTKINNAFMKKYPNIHINYQYSETEQTLDTAVRSNSLPDIFFVQGNKTPKMALYVKSGALLPLDKYKLNLSRYSKEAVNYGTVNGHIYSSLPSFMDSQLIYYNKDIFKKYGIDKPKTFADFVTLLQTLKSKGITPIAMPGKDSFYRSWLPTSLVTSLANKTLESIDSGKTNNFSDPNVVKAFQTLHDFAVKGYFSRDLVSLDTGGAQLSFTNGNAAMISDGTWSYQTYKAALGDKLGTFYIPSTDGKEIAPLSYSNLTTYAVSAKTKHPAEAVKYIKFLNSLEAQQIFEDQTGQVPTINDIKPRDKSVEELASYDSLGKNIGAVLTKLSTDKVDLSDVYMNKVLPQVLTGKFNGEEAVKLLNNALQETK